MKLIKESAGYYYSEPSGYRLMLSLVAKDRNPFTGKTQYVWVLFDEKKVTTARFFTLADARHYLSKIDKESAIG